MLDRVAQFLAHDLTPDQIHAVIKVAWRAALIAFAIYAFGGFAVFGVPGFARAADISTIQTKVASLGDTVERWRAEDKLKALEQDLAGVEREIFSIEARLAELGRLGQAADALYTQRLSELRIKHGKISREIARAEKDEALDPGGDDG